MAQDSVQIHGGCSSIECGNHPDSSLSEKEVDKSNAKKGQEKDSEGEISSEIPNSYSPLSTSTMMNSASSSPPELLDLPQELLDIIYGYMIAEGHVNILQTCKKVYYNAVNLMHEEAVFRIDLTRRTHPPGNLINERSEAAQHIELKYHPVTYYGEGTAVDILDDLFTKPTPRKTLSVVANISSWPNFARWPVFIGQLWKARLFDILSFYVDNEMYIGDHWHCTGWTNEIIDDAQWNMDPIFGKSERQWDKKQEMHYLIWYPKEHLRNAIPEGHEETSG
ncbi:hypothetical protein ACLMJK_001615 [Lecanora helva]